MPESGNLSDYGTKQVAIVGRIARILLFLLLVAVVFAAGAVSVLTLTEKGRERLAGVISDLASTEDARVRLSGLSGIWSGRLRLENLVLEDRQGAWLTARDLAVDWSPWAILGRTFSAERIAAGDVDLQRLPKSSSETASGSGGLSLPVDISINALEFPHISLGSAIAGGEIATISARGKAFVQASPLDVDAELTATRTDGVAGEVTAVVGFAPSRDQLEIDLKASEPAGGIIAGLLGLPGRPAVDVMVSGSGPADDWKGTGTFAIDGRLVASLEGTHRLTAEGSAFTARGDGAFAEFLPERYRHLVAGQTQFDIAATLTKAGGLFIERGQLEGTALSARASGQIDPEGATDFSLELTAAGGGVPVGFGTDEAPIDLVIGSASVRALGDGRTPQLDISAQLPSVATNTVRMTNLMLALESDGFDIEKRVGPFTGNATAAALTIDNPTVEPLVAGEIRAAIAGVLEPDTLTVNSGSLRSDAIDGGFDGRVSLADGAIRLGLKATVQSAALPQGARPLLGETVALSTTLNRTPDGNVSAEELALSSGGLNLGGKALLSGGQIDASLDGTVADIAPAVPGGSGAIRLGARATGSLVGPAVTATITSDNLSYDGRDLRDLELTAGGTLDGASPDITIALKAAVEDQPVTMNAIVSLAEAEKVVRDLSLAIGQNTIAGTLTLNDAFLPQGTLALQLPDLEALARLAGQSVQGSLTGTATFVADAATGTLELDARAPSITTAGRTATDVSINATVSNYTLDPTLAGQVGATVADLVPGQPPAEIRVSLDGKPADLRANGTLAMEGQTITSFAATYAQAAGGGRVELTGDAALSRLLPEGVRIVAPDPTRFDVAAVLGGSAVRIERATVSNAALTATASGEVDPAGSMDLTLDIGAGTSATLALGTAESPLDISLRSATVRARGPFARPALDLTADLASVVAPGARVTDLALALQSEGLDVETRSGPISGSVTAGAVSLDNQTVAPLVAGTVRAEFVASLTPDAVTITQGTLTSDAVSGRLSGSVSLAGGGIALDLAADVASAALPAAARPALGERVALSAKVARSEAGAVSVEDIDVSSGPLAAKGQATLDAGTIKAAIEGTLGNVAPLTGQASGAIAFSASASGNLAAPDLDVAVTSKRLTVADRVIEDLAFNATGKADLAKPEANVTLRGTVSGEALNGRAVVATTDSSRALRDLELSLGKNRISGSLALDENFVPSGSIDIDVPDIGPLAALALEEVEGSVRGNVVFDRQNGAPRARVALNSDSIRRGDLSLRQADIQAVVTDLFAAPGVSGHVRVGELRSGTTIVSDTDLELAQDGTWTRFNGGATVSDMPVKASGRVQVAGGTTTVELATAEATVQGVKTALSRPTAVRIADGTAHLDRLALNLGGGTATVTGTAGASMDLTVQLSSIPASLANAFASGLGAEGPISGDVAVTGTGANPNVRFNLNWTGAQTSQTRSAGVGALTIRSNGTYAGNRLTFDATAAGGGGLDFRGGGTVALAGAPNLDLSFRGSVPLRMFEAQTAGQGIGLSGTASVDVAVRGPATAPAITGSVRSSDARVIYVPAGIALEGLSIDVALGQGRATISRLTGKLSSGGTVTIAGTVGIDGNGFPADLTIKVAEGRYTDGRVVTTTVNADLALRGPLAGSPALTGTVNLARTVIQIPERLPASLAALDVQHRDAPEAVMQQARELQPPQATGGSSSGMTVDITVNAPQRIFVQGRGLDAELGGSLRLVGSLSSPQATGEFTLRRGRLSLLGRRLNFTEGTITFAGSLVPYLNFAAQSSASDATVTVRVSGRADDPKFSFSSVPALPEDEVLARLIFGRAMGSLSPLQIAQLADAAATLAGQGGTTSLLSTLRDRLGVDDLDVRTNDDGGTSVAVGKYLNDRTYLTIEAGDRAGSSKAAIDLDIGRGVKLRGEAYDDGQTKGGIFFEREY